jgi:hypothetical protein
MEEIRRGCEKCREEFEDYQDRGVRLSRDTKVQDYGS